MSERADPSRPLKRLPVVPGSGSLGKDGHRRTVHPADVGGRFTVWRRIVFVLLIGVYAILPWVKVGGHPAVFIHIERREFYLFGATFNAQDIWLTVFLITGFAFGLVYLTALAGRVWCGWACPQTVFLEVVRRVERLIQGPREQRLRRSKAPLTLDKVWRLGLSQFVYLLISFVLAHVFIAYFVSVPGLLAAMREAPSEHPQAFVIVFALTGVLWFNFGWFREQFCVVMCPYGRLQSVLLDSNSLVIGYDGARGEPRGKKTDPNAGDCVDCKRCVVVCPTGIDIREGLQMDCIACAQCIDACDEIMDKLGRKRGLVRYDSPAGLIGKKTKIVRPRVMLYTVLGAIGLAVATFSFSRRGGFEANVLRVTGAPYAIEDGEIRNAFTIHLVNKAGSQAEFELVPVPKNGANFTIPIREPRLDSLREVSLPLFVTIPKSEFHGDLKLEVDVIDKTHGANKRVTLPFLGPKK